LASKQKSRPGTFPADFFAEKVLKRIRGTERKAARQAN
jgi:hypothetical protein